MTKSNVVTASSYALLLIAASSLLSMIGLTQIDRIVNHDLYMYGLQFSYGWAIPYWTMTTIVFAVGWFNIILAITFQLYAFLSRRREAELPTVQEEPLKSEAPSILQPAAEGKQAETEKTEEAEKPKETQTPAVEAEQKHDENKEETPKTIEGPAQYEPSEAKPPEEEQKEQGAKPAESAEPKPEVTPTSPAEKQPETQEKSEETPTLVGVP